VRCYRDLAIVAIDREAPIPFGASEADPDPWPAPILAVVEMVVVEKRGQVFGGATVEVLPRPVTAPGYAAIVRVGGEHDIASIPRIRETLGSIHGNVLVDLSDCTFLDSSVIHALVDDARERRREWESLELIVPVANTSVARTLRISGLSTLLVVHESTDFRQCDL
jgi:anti-anti-sigma factor